MKKSVVSSLVILLSLSVLLTACAPTAATPTPAPIPTVKAADIIVAEGRIEPVRFAQLSLNANGLVSDVLVKEGDTVTAGQVIARLKNSQAKTLEQAQADALQAVTAAYEAERDAQYNLDQFDVPVDFAGQTPQQAINSTLDKLNAARDAFEPYKWMSDNQLKLTTSEQQNNSLISSTAKLRKKQLDDAWVKYRKAVQWLEDQSALESAHVQLAQAKNDYTGLQDASLAENTAGTRAALANAELRSPFSGTVTNLDLKVGQFAASGQSVVTVADFSSWVVKTTDLTEIDVVNIKEGQPVTLTLDAIPDATIKGYVLSIAQNYGERQGDVVYEVTVLLTDKQPSMRWGMTAQVNFAK